MIAPQCIHLRINFQVSEPLGPLAVRIVECGEGFIRCAYATSMDNLKEAMVRLKRFIAKL